MYDDTMNDMDMDSDEVVDAPDDSGVLTGEQVQELATMNPILVYDDGRVKVGILKGVREGGYIRPLSIQMQGVRDGVLTYKAGGTLTNRPLVPVLCLMEAALVDRMRVSPGALALGKAAIDSLNPTTPAINPLVDVLVEEYVEAAPIEREFFLPSVEGNDDSDALPTMGGTPDMPSVEEVMTALGTTESLKGLIDNIDPGFYGETLNANDPGFYSGTDTLVGNDPGFMQPVTYADPTSDPNFTGTITFGGYVQEQAAVNTQELGTVEQVIPEPAIIEDGEGTVHVSDNLDASAYQSPEALSVHPDHSPSSDLVDMAVEPMAVPGQGAVAYTVDPMGLPVIETEANNYPGQYTEPLPAVGVVTTAEWQGAPVSLEPGVQEDGRAVPFDPRLHQLPM